MGFKGSVESFSLADVFQNLAMNQQTGTLHVHSGTGAEKYVYFQSGQVRYLSSGPSRLLVPPTVFLARGVITVAQLDAGVQKQNETGKSISAELVELGHVTVKQVDEVIKVQMEEEIFDLFGWDKASFEFEEAPAADADLFKGQTTGGKGPSLPISHLIMEAARRVDEWDRLKKQVPSSKEIYHLDPVARKAIEKGEMETDPIEKRVASLLDCTRDVEDLIADSFLFTFEVMNALSGFIQSSLVRPATVPELLQAEQDCVRQNLLKRRIKVLERILALGGENLRVRKELAESLARDQQVDKACIHYTVLADAELGAKSEDGAVDLYRRVLSLSPKHIKAHEQLGTIYQKRGQKREAFIHFQELFEAYRSQNNPRDARAAAVKALECDPNHNDIRNGLIEMLINDNQKEAASQQLEIIGDQAAKQGNVKFAADSYRRSMTYRPNNTQLKNKLADVMLTKEDRVARKRKASAVVFVVILVAAACGAMFFFEKLNQKKYIAADEQAQPSLMDASRLERESRFDEAIEKYREAMESYERVSTLFSPVLQLHKKAQSELGSLQEKIVHAQGREVLTSTTLGAKSEKDFEEAESARNNKQIYKARDKFDEVLRNIKTSEKLKQDAQAGRDDVEKRIVRFENGLKRLKAESAKEFENVEKEAEWKTAFIDEFRGTERLNVGEIMLPLLLKPETDQVQVLLNGNSIGTITSKVSDRENTFYFPIVGTQRFDFKKPGYKPYSFNTSELKGYVQIIRLEREPNDSIRIKLEGGVTLKGEPTTDGSAIYVGTSEGELFQLVPGNPNVARRYKLAGGNPLHKEVMGSIYVHKRAGGKPDIIVYGTRAGDCVGLLAPEGKNTFVEAWNPVRRTGPTLSAPPSVVRLPLVLSSTIFVMPAEKKLLMIDCDSGTEVLAGRAPEFGAKITSAAAGIDSASLIAAGCADGKLWGLSLTTSGGITKSWFPNAGAGFGKIQGKPVAFDKFILAGADDGRIYLFDPSRGYADGKIDLPGAGEIVSAPLVVNKRIFVGSIGREGVWCADPDRLREQLWKYPRNPPAIGGVEFTPVFLNGNIYFGTDTGELHCVSAADGKPRWSFKIDGGAPVVGSPVIVDKRVYAITKDGHIVGFEERAE